MIGRFDLRRAKLRMRTCEVMPPARGSLRISAEYEHNNDTVADFVASAVPVVSSGDSQERSQCCFIALLLAIVSRCEPWHVLLPRHAAARFAFPFSDVLARIAGLSPHSRFQRHTQRLSETLAELDVALLLHYAELLLSTNGVHLRWHF